MSRLQAQPLKPLVVYKPARPRQRPDSSSARSRAARGGSSANDVVTLVAREAAARRRPAASSGCRSSAALPKLEKLKLAPSVRPSDAASSRRVLRQSPRPGVAAAPGMTVKLVVRAG